jgi:hypothetical protein
MVSDLDFLDSHHKYPPLGEFDNQKAIRLLKREQKARIIASGLYVSIPGTVLLTPFSLVSPLLMPMLNKMIKGVEKVSNNLIVMSTLLDHFGDQGIEIIPCVQVSKEETGIDQIDLLVRVPVEKVYFAICVRKIEQSKIVFNDEKHTLMIRHKKRLTSWRPDPQAYLPKATVWLQKNKGTIFGPASNDRRRPIAKVLVLLGSTQIGKHRSEHYDTLGNQQVLCIQDKSRVFIVHHQENLCSFVANFIGEYGKVASKLATSHSGGASSKSKSAKKSKLLKSK